MNQADALRWIISLLIPALAGFAGVLIGALLTGKREQRQRRLQFVSDQLRYFYSPLLGIRTEIRTRSELRAKISVAADSAWRELCARFESAGPLMLQDLLDEREKEFSRIIEYDNRIFNEELLPAYRQMIKIFRENLWLAEPETRACFDKLLEFVDVWDRWQGDSLPVEVLRKLSHGEAELKEFYEHLEREHDSLRTQLASGEPHKISRAVTVRGR